MTSPDEAAGGACPACGAPTPAAARFCPACGARLLGGGEERRVVTALFADIVESTRLVETLDPEAARDLLGQAFRRLAAEVRRFGGTLEKYVGDAVFAVFGFPTGHDDDAARAVRAALAMREAVKAAGAPPGGAPLRLSIGLDTGEVAAGVFAGDLRVTGDAVHTAARIQQAAAPDQILASARTLRAARDLLAVGEPRSLRPRGKQRPVEVVEVLGLAPAEPRHAALVDREQDLPRLVAALDRAADAGRLVLLVGEPGVGKTTLIRAAAERLGARVRVLWGRCLPDWQSLPFWPLREVLAAAARVPATTPPGELAGAIGRLVAETWPDPPTAPSAAAALCRLAGLEAAGQGAAPSAVGARELAATVAGVLCGLAGRQRLLVVLEDLHWATPDLLEVAAVLVAGGCPAGRRPAFLGVTRPGLAEAAPGWLRRAGGDRIDLGALPEGPAAELLAATLGAPADPALAGRVFEASQGNPLFVKELALAVRETGAGRGGSRLRIPDSLQALIAARLDRLPAASKRTLCLAAVVGKWFSTAAVAALAAQPDAAAAEELQRLAAAGLIEPLAGEERWAFHHTLFREVAYALLPKAGRSALHQRLAGWLEQRGAPAQVVAFHLVAAVRLAGQVRAPSAADRALAARAVAACRRAAERLRGQEALLAAVRVLDDALALAGPGGTPAAQVAELRALRGTLRGATGDVAGAVDDLEAAGRAAAAGVRALALTELSNLHGDLNDHARAAELAERALAEAAADGSPGLRARALRARARGPFLAGDLVGAERLLQQALGLARAGDLPGLAIDLRSTLLPLRLYLAAPLDRVAAEAAALAAAAGAAGRRNAAAGADYVLGEVAALRGDLDAAERHYAAADRTRREIGLAAQRIWSLLGLARVATQRGDAARAAALAEEAIALTTTPEGAGDPEALLHLAEARLAALRPADADAAVARARTRLQPRDVATAAALWRTAARVAAARGDRQAAVGLLERSLDELAGSDYRLERLRTLADLAGALAAAGRPGRAAAVREQALEQAAAVGADALVAELALAPVGPAAPGDAR